MSWSIRPSRNDQTLKSGYEFLPFGVAHDNPLYAVGELPAEIMEVLEAFAGFAAETPTRELGRKYGFDPPCRPIRRLSLLPSGGTLIARHSSSGRTKKNAGRPIAAVFLCDVSGSMSGGGSKACAKR